MYEFGVNKIKANAFRKIPTLCIVSPQIKNLVKVSGGIKIAEQTERCFTWLFFSLRTYKTTVF